jgi:ribosome-associated protein
MATPQVTVPEREFEISFVRATGPGGQNVNKVASAAQLRFHIGGSSLMNEAAKGRLRTLAGQRLTGTDTIVIIARSHRTQEGNRRDALERLQTLIERALIVPKTRHATRPTRGSKERRLEQKSAQQGRKRLRGRVGFDD